MSDSIYKEDFRYCAHEDKLFRRLTQPSEDLILERNKKLRNNPGVLQDLSFGRQVASIPENAYEAHCREDPELRSPDKQIRQRALFRLLQSAEGRKYLVREKL